MFERKLCTSDPEVCPVAAAVALLGIATLRPGHVYMFSQAHPKFKNKEQVYQIIERKIQSFKSNQNQK